MRNKGGKDGFWDVFGKEVWVVMSFFAAGFAVFAACLECVLRLYRIAAIYKGLCGVARGFFSKTAVGDLTLLDFEKLARPFYK